VAAPGVTLPVWRERFGDHGIGRPVATPSRTETVASPRVQVR
jgi:hypothetical protein